MTAHGKTDDGLLDQIHVRKASMTKYCALLNSISTINIYDKMPLNNVRSRLWHMYLISGPLIF